MPLTHAPGDSFVALAARRHKMPFVLFACGDALWIARMELRDRESLPITEGNFGKSLLKAITIRRQSKYRAHKLHGLAGASERAGHIVEVRGASTASRKQVTQDVSAMAGLRATPPIQRYVMPTLQTTGYVPVGFSVTDVIDRRRRHRR